MPARRSHRSRLRLALAGAIVMMAVGAPASADHCGVVQLAGCDHAAEPTDPQPQPEPSEPDDPPASDDERDGAPQDEPASEAAPATTAAAELVRLLNQERTAHGLAPFALRDDVTGIAQEHSLRMARAEEIFHNDHYFSAATKAQIGAARRAENVAMSGTAAQAHRRLMDSPPHRANVLDGGLTQVGVAAATDETGFLYFTQAFLEPTTVASGPTATPIARAAPSNQEPSTPTTGVAGAERRSAVLGLPEEAVFRSTGSSRSGILPTVGAVSSPGAVPAAAVLGLALFAMVTAAMIRAVNGWAVDRPGNGRAVRS